MNAFKVTTVFLFAVLLCSSSVKAQKDHDHSRNPWMDAWISWNANQGDVQVQMVEAKAKLISAQAAMVTAVANANKANAEALQGLEEARSLSLDNSLKKAETFYGKRTLHDNYRRIANPQIQTTSEDVARRSRNSTPDRLTEEELDQVNGEINWPSLLRRNEFVEHRDRIEVMFFGKYSYSLDAQTEVRELADEMQGTLRSLIDEVPPAEYMQARRFIGNLAYEFRFSSQKSG